MEKKVFGTVADGTEYSIWSFTNKNNMTMTLTDLGATLVNVLVPDKDGVVRDMVLGYDTPQGYLDNDGYFGTVIGRNGNRIDKAKFEINGKVYQLAVNDNENNLHSGPNGFDSRKYDVAEVTENSIKFTIFSPDGDEGFPGNFTASVTYTLTDDNEVVLHYEATCDADTVANMTNHTYFNIGGHDSGTILDQVLTLYAPHYTPVRDSQAIPTGEIAPVAGTPMDFTAPKAIGLEIDADFEQLVYGGGYDHNYVLSLEAGEWKKMAEAYSAKSGITMEAYTDCCGVQFYAGNMITKRTGKGGAVYEKRHGFCLESQYYPNAINQEGFASSLLKAGEKYDTKTSYKFYVK